MDHQSDSQPSLRLPADCSIASIRSIYDLICNALRRQERLEIDCSGVDKADITSIQLLLSTTKSAHLQGRRVNLTSFSQALRTTIQRAGFSNSAMLNRNSAQHNEPN
jgi:ABC-type transporter Mla MlaB component